MLKDRSFFNRLLSWLMAAVMVWSITFPPGFQLNANAEEEETSQETTVTTTTITLNLTNCSIVTPEGGSVTSATELEIGSNLAFKVVPDSGCKAGTVKINGTTNALDPNNTYTVTVTEGLVIQAVSNDVTDPTMSEPARAGNGWVPIATYTFTATDNVGIASAMLIDSAALETALERNTAGEYVAAVPSNGTYTIRVTDADGNSTESVITETMVDADAPSITKLERQTVGIATEAEYLLTAEDIGSDIAKVTVQVSGGTENEQTVNDDGSYTIIITENTTYTVNVYDRAGNKSSPDISDSKIDSEGPAFQDLTRNESGWQKDSATYSFKVTDNMAGVASVTLAAKDGSTQPLTPATDGTYAVTVVDSGSYLLTAEDNLGNTTQETISETQIDHTAPAMGAPTRTETDWTFKATYIVNPTDTESGITKVTVINESGTSVDVMHLDNGSYQFFITENGTYTVTATNGTGVAVQQQISEAKIDTTSPVIGTVKRASSDWETEASYSFEVTDTQSGVRSVTVQIGDSTPTTLTAADGKYSFTIAANEPFVITAMDTAGNAVNSNGEETKVDITAPAVSEIKRQQNGWATSATYTFTANDTQTGIKEISVKLGGSDPVTLTPSNGTYSFTVDSNVSFTITATDNLGNTSTTNGKESMIDNTNPVISTPSRTNSKWTTSAQYTFTVKDTQSGIKSVTVTVSGNTTTLTEADGNYSFTMETNEAYTITAIDNLGHISTISGSESKIDTTAPIIASIDRLEDGWTTFASYNIAATDDLSGVAAVKITFGDGTTRSLTEKDGSYSFIMKENDTFTVIVEDAAGNQTSQNRGEYYVDAKAPFISKPVRQDESWTESTRYTFTTEDALSGVQTVTVQYADNAPQTLLADESGKYSFTAKANGAYVISVIDIVGNRAILTVDEQFIDTTPPALLNLSRVETGWETSATYTFAVEETQSGLQRVLLAIGDEAAQEIIAEEGVYSFTLTENTTFTITAVDNLENMSIYDTSEERIDTIAPVIYALERQERGWATSATYTFSVEETLSGVQTVTVQYADNAPQTLLADESGKYSFTMNSNAPFVITAIDAVDNISTLAGKETQIDIAVPAISAPVRNTEGWATSADYAFTVEGGQSGIKSVAVRYMDGTEKTLTPSEDGIYSFTAVQNGDYTVTAINAVGNSSSVSITEKFIDTNAPEITDLVRVERGWATSATVTFEATDSQSGINAVTVKIGTAEPLQLTATSDGFYSFTMKANDTFLIEVIDTVGNTASVSGEESLVDTTAPAISDPVRKGSSWSDSAEYSITVEDNQSGIAAVTVASGSGKPVTLNADKNGVYTYIAAENTTFTVTATDKVGNTATTTFTESQVDVTAPAVTNIKRDPDDWSRDSTYTFAVKDTQSGIGSVSVMFEGSNINIADNGNGTYTFNSVANGEYAIIAVDLVGNTTTIFVGETLIDLTPPAIHSVVPQSTWHHSENTIVFKISDESTLTDVELTDINGTAFTVTSTSDDTFEAVVNANGKYTIAATDSTGNTSTQSFTVWHIDTGAPTKPVLTSSTNEQWTNTDVNLTAVSSDDQSGVVAYWYSTENSTFNTATWKKMDFAGGIGSLHLSTNQDTDYFVIAQDEVGRVSESEKIHVSIDKTAPGNLTASYVTGNNSGFNRIVNSKYIYNDFVSFHAEATDSASGVVKYEYQIVDINGDIAANGIADTVGKVGFTAKIDYLDDGIYSLRFYAIDLAGNRSDAFAIVAGGETVEFIIENTPRNNGERSAAPDVAMTTSEGKYNQEWTSDDVTIILSGSNAVSGIEYYEYAVDCADPQLPATNWSKVPVVNGKFQLTANTDTNATYSFRAVTFAGNYSKTTSHIVKVQKTAPVARSITSEAATGTNGWYTKYPSYTIGTAKQNPYFAPVHYLITCTHDGVTSEYRFDENNAPTINADGIWVVTVTSVDEAGNRATISSSTAHFNVDTQVPTGLDVTREGESILSVRTDAASAWNQVNFVNLNQMTDFTIFRNASVTIQATADGGASGMAAIYYQAVAENEDYSELGAWAKLPEAGFQLKPNDKYCLFFKAVDVAGNITYFSGKSILVDDTAPETLTFTATSNNRSDRGFYYDDVTINYSVADPAVGAHAALSGLQSVAYRVLQDGVVTQKGVLFPGSKTANKNRDGLTSSCSGSFVINAQQNNSNNIIVELITTDNAGNSNTTYIRQGEIKIDIDAPTMEGSYNTNSVTATLGTDSIFTGSRTLTVVATERNLDAARSFVKATDTDTGRTFTATWTSEGDKHTAVLALTEDGHYTVSATITDNAGNKTSNLIFVDGTVAGNKFVIDNTSPTITFTYDNNNAKNVVYFDAPRTITVQVIERNFDPAKIGTTIRRISENGGISNIHLSAWKHDGNTHWATAVCSQNGNYTVSVSGADAVGNVAAKAVVEGASPYVFTIDTSISAPQISGVENGAAYAGKITPVISAKDANLESVEVKIYRTKLGEIRKDVTSELLGDTIQFESTENSWIAMLDVFAATADNDGIYTIAVTDTDKAGNTNSSEITFSLNRFGSVYVYDEALVNIIGDTMQTLAHDLIITEYNASGLVSGSARVYITVDGIPVSDPIYTVVPSVDGTDQPGSSGWHEYQYIISKDNFTQDGQYTVVISTQDEAGNLPENTSDEQAIRFAIDTTAPELPSIIGMEKQINKADALSVTVSARDNVQLDNIVIYIDGIEVARWENIDDFQYEDVFSIPSGLDQHVRIIVTDKAGNVLDTDSAEFAPGYEFQDAITVSSNFWLRFYANRPVFWGSVIGLICFIAIILILIFAKKNKKDKNASQTDSQK